MCPEQWAHLGIPMTVTLGLLCILHIAISFLIKGMGFLSRHGFKSALTTHLALYETIYFISLSLCISLSTF